MLERFKDIWQRFDAGATGYIKIFELPALLAALNDPLGWEGPSKMTEQERLDFVTALKLPIYNNFQDYQYVDVLLALAKRLLIEDEVNQYLLANPEGDPDPVARQLEEDIDELERNNDMIHSVKQLKKKEKRLKEEVNKHHQGSVFTAKHEQAARLLIQHMRLFVRAHRLRRGVQIRHHTKHELEEIDRRLVEEFKRMHEREAGILRPEDLQEA